VVELLVEHPDLAHRLDPGEAGVDVADDVGDEVDDLRLGREVAVGGVLDPAWREAQSATVSNSMPMIALR
jgi:hypothetical protein